MRDNKFVIFHIYLLTVLACDCTGNNSIDYARVETSVTLLSCIRISKYRQSSSHSKSIIAPPFIPQLFSGLNLFSPFAFHSSQFTAKLQCTFRCDSKNSYWRYLNKFLPTFLTTHQIHITKIIYFFSKQIFPQFETELSQILISFNTFSYLTRSSSHGN